MVKSMNHLFSLHGNILLNAMTEEKEAANIPPPFAGEEAEYMNVNEW